MTLPISGQISMQQVAAELKLPAGQVISLNDSVVRTLAGKTSGQISLTDLWGKNATPVPQPTGNYISGGPVNNSGGLYWGCILTNLGAIGPMGTAKDLHYLGAYPVVAIISDGGNNIIIKIGGTNSQPPMPYNTFRIEVGGKVYDYSTSILFWTPDQASSGMIGLTYGQTPVSLSPVGTQFKVDFLNK